MVARYRIIAYDAAGAEVKNIEFDAGEDGPEFYAHQLLHADVITHVQVHNAETGELILDRSEPVEAHDDDMG
jgi:hypothetical protein